MKLFDVFNIDTIHTFFDSYSKSGCLMLSITDSTIRQYCLSLPKDSEFMTKTELRKRTRARESSNAIERLYITMRHLLNRGFYKPYGVSGHTLMQGLLTLRPEIYGDIATNKVELNGLKYVMDRLPEGIEECRVIHMTDNEGYRHSQFKPIIPPKRRRHCYRIDKDQMNIEITRGRSDVYDILTHLTFLFIESHKIREKAVINKEGTPGREWLALEKVVLDSKKLKKTDTERIIAYLSTLLGRTFEEAKLAYEEFKENNHPNRFFHIIYWLGKLAINEAHLEQKREIKFAPRLRESIGHHVYGEIWATNIKKHLQKQNLLQRPIHIISSNMHSVLNVLFATKALKSNKNEMTLYKELSQDKHQKIRDKVIKTAQKNGMIYLKDYSGANIDVQIFDTAKFKDADLPAAFYKQDDTKKPVLIVMDYAFGEQAFEVMDELLKPYEEKTVKQLLNVQSISIMGKAGILVGNKGDIMIPKAHMFEGTADNYPIDNQLSAKNFEKENINVYEGTMVTVLGTSLQNKDILSFFKNSTWQAIGLEMEGAHYHKAIQSASKIRGNINANVKVRYAYYASDNPLQTGSTLASGPLGVKGVEPTYMITKKILQQIF